MPRPIWKGFISFGLVNVPVMLFTAERQNELRFHLLDRRNRSRIQYGRLNEKTGEEVPWEEIVRAYEYTKGHYVTLEDEDFEKAAVESSETIEIGNFVDEKSIDFIYFNKPYYLVPDKKGEKGYVLLREVLRKMHTAGIAKVVLRTRQYLTALIVVEDALVLNLLRFKDELIDQKEFNLPKRNLKTYKISSKEVEIAEQLVKAMTTPWNPDLYHDDYRDALLQLISRKAKGKPLPEIHVPERKPAKVIDFMDLLKKSVEEKKTKERTPHGKKRTRH